MPITIAPPLLDQPTGPGFFQAWETDFIGPIPAGSFWRVKFSTAVQQETTLFQYTIGTDQHQYQGVLGAAGGHLEAVASSSNLPAQAAAHMTVELVDGQSVVIDSGGKNVIWDPVSGIHSLLPYVSPSTLEGGYTESDRSVAAQSLSAVRALFPSGISGVADLVLDIGQLFTNPPVEILRRDTFIDLTGRGTLLYPDAGPDVSAYGAWLELLTPPAGAGFRDGVVREYELRVAQFAVYGRHGNTQQYVKYLYDLNWAGQYLIWGAPFPRRIVYDITPGFVVRWRWLVLGIQP